MAKTEKELQLLKQEYNEMQQKLDELTAEELQQVTGGAGALFDTDEVSAFIGKIASGKLGRPLKLGPDYNTDSLDVVDVVSVIEQEFNIKIDPIELKDISGTQGLGDLIRSKLK